MKQLRIIILFIGSLTLGCQAAKEPTFKEFFLKEKYALLNEHIKNQIIIPTLEETKGALKTLQKEQLKEARKAVTLQPVAGRAFLGLKATTLTVVNYGSWFLLARSISGQQNLFWPALLAKLFIESALEDGFTCFRDLGAYVDETTASNAKIESIKSLIETLSVHAELLKKE